jgi:hypothetical protein
MPDTDTIRTDLYLDHGPVWDAARTLVRRSTLAEHVLLDVGGAGRPAHVWHDPEGVPFAVWGSGTQALWRLLTAMAYSGEVVSLYEVASRCDTRNRSAVAASVAALMGATR